MQATPVLVIGSSGKTGRRIVMAHPAYDQCIKASHLFNLLDARKAISVTERQRFILRVRGIARASAEGYFNARAELGFPLADPELRDAVLAARKEAAA